MAEKSLSTTSADTIQQQIVLPAQAPDTKPGKRVSLPVAGYGAVSNLCRPPLDRDVIDDLALGMSASSSVHLAVNLPPGPQVLCQFLLQALLESG
jgi:hypothetical protein